MSFADLELLRQGVRLEPLLHTHWVNVHGHKDREQQQRVFGRLSPRLGFGLRSRSTNNPPSRFRSS
jgi:hypothetical protein